MNFAYSEPQLDFTQSNGGLEVDRGLNTTQLEGTMNLLLGKAKTTMITSCKMITFLGVFPLDLFPFDDFLSFSATNSSYQQNISSKVLCCIVNTDPSNKPGTHWVAFFMEKSNKQISSTLEFFDSYGLHPSAYSFNVTNFNIIYNKETLQSISSNVCGHYCMLYLYLRSLYFYSNINSSTLEAHNHVIVSLRRIAPTCSKRDETIPLILCQLISKNHFLYNLSILPNQSLNFLSPLNYTCPSPINLSPTSIISKSLNKVQSCQSKLC